MNAAALSASNSGGAHREVRRGFGYGVAAYGLWGVLPIYFKAIDNVSAFDIVAHRVLWSLPFLALHHLHLPSLLWCNLRAGRPWLKIDVNIGKLVEPAGD